MIQKKLTFASRPSMSLKSLYWIWNRRELIGHLWLPINVPR